MADSSVQASDQVGSSGATFSTDLVGGEHVPLSKLAFGAYGTVNLVDSTATNPFPVALSDVDNAVLDTINTAVVATQAAVEGTLTVGSHAVTNTGTFVVQEDGAALTALQLIDDIVHIDDTATHATGTTKGAGIMAAATPTDSTVDVNDIGMVAMSTDRRLHVDADVTASVALDVSAATVTVAGTVTANLSATDNAVLDTIATPVATISATPLQRVAIFDAADAQITSFGGGTQYTEGATDATITGTAMLMEGAADALVVAQGTAADGLLVNLGTNNDVQIDAAAVTSLALIDDSIFADDAAFTLASSKVDMAGAIRDDSLSTLTAIEGDAVPLRVNSTGALHVTGGGGGTEYTLGTDTFLEGTSIGSGAAVVRNDGGGSLVNTDNEWTVLQVDSAGALRVTGGGGGTEYSEDVATPATIVGTATLVERDDALTTVTPIEGDWIGLRGTAEGALWVQDFNSDSIDGKITACDTGAVVIASGTVTAVTDITNPVTVDWNGTAPPIGAGVEATALRVTIATDSTGSLTVDGPVTDTELRASPVVVDLGANNDVTAGGDIAHDAANSGNPLQLGAQAIAHGTNPTAVAAADRTRLYANRAGIPFVIGGHPNVQIQSARNTGAQTDTALVTVAGGSKIVVTRISMTVDNSCTVDVDFECGFGATTVPTAATGAGVSGMLADFMGIAAGGGITIGDGSGILGVGADGEDLRYSNTAPTSGNCTISVSYYTIES